MDEITIENWEILFTGYGPYQAPESYTKRLAGLVYGHPQFPDGTQVNTSRIVDICGNHVKTVYHNYVLGQPHKRYAEWCKQYAPDTKFDWPRPQEPNDVQAS